MKSNSVSVLITFTVLVYVIILGGITGCSRKPSDSNISDAVKGYCESSGGLYGMLNTIKLPDTQSQPVPGLFVSDERIKISDVRVVKRGKTFHSGSGENSLEGFPVRVYVKGIKIVDYSKFNKFNAGVEHINNINLPFEGETDFFVTFEPPDKSKVDPGEGKWIAQPVH